MSARQDVMWLMRRLAVMSPREIAHRVRTVLRNAVEALAWRVTGRWPGLEPAGPAGFGFMVSESRQLFEPPVDLARLPVTDLLEGRIPVFGHWATWHPAAEFWHTDPLTGARWPYGHGSRPEHRPGNPVGDARVIWELNRLQHLVSLALIGRAQPEQRVRAAGLIGQHLESWCEANPFPWGINHSSAMEEALRVIAVLHAYDLMRDSVEESTRVVVTRLLCTHGWHIERGLSLYSSAGNHTIAEAVGLLYLGLMLPEHPRAAAWVRLARELLATESARQVRDDGGSLEQATWYLLFITDLMGLAQLLLAHVGAAPIPEVDSAVERARDFLGTLAGSADRLPRIGDADDGYALSPGLQLSFSRHRPGPVQRTFPSTGITVVSFDGHDQLLFLHKDLGMPPNYGHGHSDLLSVIFRWKDRDVLIDPGTYMYGGDPALRRYFRSAAGHNTVAANGLDQAIQVGPFIWREASSSQRVWQESDSGHVSILARHHGHQDPDFQHWR
ncbi:MAG: heparinase II/III family protein, partial [Gammaproteobacteria bacterium]|nr:heparinase II/III family protein [Gammaproteobacteria bacterium]